MVWAAGSLPQPPARILLSNAMKSVAVIIQKDKCRNNLRRYLHTVYFNLLSKLQMEFETFINGIVDTDRMQRHIPAVSRIPFR
jgi:hypothetical protein